jgi:hypothetical protein
MARAGLRWTIEDLSQNADVGSRTIKRLEGSNEIVSANLNTLSKIKNTLEAAGIEFIGTPENAPGIRIHVKPAGQE